MIFDHDDLRNISFFINAVEQASKKYGVDMESTDLYIDGEKMGTMTHLFEFLP